MMNKYATMLAITAGLSLGSHIALAQTPNVAAPRPGPEAPLPATCKELVGKGFTIKHQTILRSGTAATPVATHPRNGSFAAPRKYGQSGDDVWFIDSFDSHPKEGCRICGVTVAVIGNVSANSVKNDSITLVGSNSTAPQIIPSPLHFNPAHTRLNPVVPAGGPLAQGPLNMLFTIEGPAWMGWYMASLVPSFDVMVQDDTTVNSIEVTYYYY